MATIGQITVYDTTLTEVLNDEIALNIAEFSKQSAIIVEGRTVGGSFLNQDFTNLLGGLRYRDPASTDAVVEDDFSLDDVVAVKLGRYKAIRIPTAILEWKDGDDVTDSVLMATQNMGKQIAEYIIVDQLETSVIMLVGAISAETDSVYEPGSVIDIHSINDTKNLFGDKSKMLSTIIMHASAYNALLKAGMTKNDTLFDSGKLKVASAIESGGGIIIVVDIDTLSYDDAGTDKYRILALADGAAKISQSKESVNSELDLSKVNNTSLTKYEGSYFIKLKGISFSGAITAPTDAELATGTNYTRVADSVKGTAGVIGEFLVTAV